jgi:hypothetical protein
MSDNFVRYGKKENLIDLIYKFCELKNIKVVKFDIKNNYFYNKAPNCFFLAK